MTADPAPPEPPSFPLTLTKFPVVLCCSAAQPAFARLSIIRIRTCSGGRGYSWAIPSDFSFARSYQDADFCIAAPWATPHPTRRSSAAIINTARPLRNMLASNVVLTRTASSLDSTDPLSERRLKRDRQD